MFIWSTSHCADVLLRTQGSAVLTENLSKQLSLREVEAIILTPSNRPVETLTLTLLDLY